MIYIITGKIGSGKTNKLGELYSYIGGDGYILDKAYSNNVYIGQNIIRLSTGDTLPFTRIDGHISNSFDQSEKLLNYNFSKSGLDYAATIINHLIFTRLTAFIDEIGPLELSRRGLYPQLMNLLNRAEDIYVTVRDTCISRVITLFNISSYRVLDF